MAGLSFMESFALGYMAGDPGPGLAETGVGVLHDLRYKRDLAQADADYAALVNDYNQLVDRFNALCRHAETTVASQDDRIDQLERTIANAIPLATELEQRAASLDRRAVVAEQRAAAAAAEQRDAELVRQEAQTRPDMADLQRNYIGTRNLLSVHASELDWALAEIAQLEATIASIGKLPGQDTPAPDAPAS